MKQCKCGSYALNLHKEGIDQGSLCDRHYWQDRAEKAEKDAARYRWLRDRLHCVDFYYGEDAIPALVFHISKSMLVSANLDKTLDDEIAKDAP